MRKLGLFVLTSFAAIAFAGCVAPPTNSNTTSANRPGAAVVPPTVDALKELETKAFEAYKNKDSKFFEGFLTDKFAMSEKGRRLDKPATLKMIAEHKCDVTSYRFSGEKLTTL